MANITTFPPVSGVNTDDYYNKTEVESLIASVSAGDYTAEQITESTAKQFVSATEKAEWTAKETVEGAQTKATAAGQDAKDYADLTFIEKTQKGVAGGVAALDTDGKVPTTQLALKTINGETVIGEGDIIIEAGGLDEAQLEAFLIGLEDGTLSGDEYVVMVHREQDTVTRYSLNDLIATIVSLVDTSGGGSDLDFEDRQKIDSIEFGATKNRPDVELLNRANHDGRQDISTINNLQETLDELQTQNDEFVRSQDVKKIVTMSQLDYKNLSYVDPEVLYIIVPQT